MFSTIDEIFKPPHLVQYIYKGKNRTKVGVFVAKPSLDQHGRVIGFSTGYALAHKKDRERMFNKAVALEIAVGRLLEYKNYKVPQSIRKDYGRFLDRCDKYYGESPNVN